MVEDFIVSAKILVLIFDRVEAVRASRHDAFHFVPVERLDIGLRERLIEIFIADPSGGIARALFFGA